MGEFDDLLGDVIAEVPAAPKNEYAVAPAIGAVEQLLSKDNLAAFLAFTKSAPFEGISETIIAEAYAAVVWEFRQAAFYGDIDKTRSLKMWLDWAAPYIRPKANDEGGHNPGTAAFLPREVK